MPYEYDPSKGLYKDGEQYVSRKEVRARLDGVLESLKVKAAQYARKYNDGEWTAKQFGDAMRELLESSHIAAGVLGRGGRESMQAKDWQRIEDKIAWQNVYLTKFVSKLARGTVSAASESRAKSYVSSVYVSYADAKAEAIKEAPETNGLKVRLEQSSKEGCRECEADANMGWVEPDELGEIGTRECQEFCLCEIIFSEDEINVQIRDWVEAQF